VPVALEWNFSSTKRNSWGWGAGITYTSLSWDSFTVGDSTGSVSGTTSGTTRIFSPYFSAIYRWDKVFLPVGLNISSLTHDGTPALISENKGTIGAQLGLGVIVNSNFSILIESKAFGFGGSTFKQGTTTLESGPGFSSGLNFIGLFSF
jgi:hypothetical protein